MAAAPVFALYLSSVPGRVASRPGSSFSYIGATIVAGAEPSWSPEVVVPILESEYQRYRREYDKLIRNGDVAARTEADFVAAQKAAEEAEKKHVAELEKQATEAKKAAEEATKAQLAPTGSADAAAGDLKPNKGSK